MSCSQRKVTRMNSPTDNTPTTENFRPFSKWTDEEIRNRAIELHQQPGVINVDLTRPIIRDDGETAYVPAWIEICPGD